ncbi:MAG: 2-amino-4-hydroxy-6-hydroxymethyldihydropteridine diphosphokinase [Gammaproteobacteria bacterium]|nr:2-amino-4-hydroxy-6-hydroxymethyldihydropteridine diphosphokinase [Gammaproteobacteria bacterium]
MTAVYLSLGSNIDREHHIRGAITALRHHYGPLTCSPVYESEAVGFSGDNFYNLVVTFNSSAAVATIVQTLRQIEDAHLRSRQGPRFSSRTLDIDLLLYGDLIINDAEIVIPRPEILTSAFVLKPLADLAPTMLHPQLGINFANLSLQFNAANQPIWLADCTLN